MPSFLEITSEKLNRIIGPSNMPNIIDVRTNDDFAATPRLIAGSVRRDYREVTNKIHNWPSPRDGIRS